MVGGWHQAAVLAAGFAELGHAVTGVWWEAGVVAALSRGAAAVREPGLDELLRRGIDSGRLRFTTDFAQALAGAEVTYLALDTPVADDDSPQIEPVMDAASRVGRGLSNDLIVCVSAQVPVGTTERIGMLIARESGRSCPVAYVPEFLRLGTALETFRQADRIVIGCDDAHAAEVVAGLYSPLGRPIVHMGVRSAEMAKHASNAFLAASVSFANELAALCESAGASVDDVTRAMKLDRRIGARAFLSAGMGFAGGTLGRDVRSLQHLGRDAGVATPMLDAVMTVNEGRAALVVARLRGVYGDVRGLRVGVWGLTYKAGTSTLRQSVALRVVEELTGAGAEVRAFDPWADFGGAEDVPDFALCESALDAAEGADAVVLLTEWPELAEVDPEELRRRMRRPLLLDTRNFLEPAALVAAGVTYVGIGRLVPAVEQGTVPVGGAT